jgi:NAD(P)-dependent dehydrogenase (short-subunit alcohol dehydrogenase family)
MSDVVIVTGAAGNLGAALCGVLTRRGCRVVAVDREEAAIRGRLAAAPALIVAPVDLTTPEGGAEVVARTVAALGRVDGLAHTVGGFAMGTMAQAGPELWERMHRLNLLTTLNMARAVWPGMLSAGRGSVVAVGAQPALRAPAGLAAYAAAKAGVLRLIESLADEGKAHGVRANAVLPSIIDTPQNRAAMPDADPARWVTAEQVAEAVAFLLSDAASGVTGALLPVTGRG